MLNHTVEYMRTLSRAYMTVLVLIFSITKSFSFFGLEIVKSTINYLNLTFIFYCLINECLDRTLICSILNITCLFLHSYLTNDKVSRHIRRPR